MPKREKEMGKNRNKRGKGKKEELKTPKLTKSTNNTNAPTNAHHAMHQHPLPRRQLPLDHVAQLLEALEQVLVALVALLHVEVLDALLAIPVPGLGRELFVHDGEHEVDVVGVVGCDILGGVGSVGCLFLILGNYEGVVVEIWIWVWVWEWV